MGKVPHIQVDAFAIVDDHFSGIGHYTVGIVGGLDQLAAEGKLTYSLIAPRRWKHRVAKFPQLAHYEKVLTTPLPIRVIRRLLAKGVRLWPMDLLLGKGYYYFSSFLSWPTTKASPSTVVIHDVTFEAVPECVHEGNRKYLSRVVPHSLRNSKNVITVSQFSKDEVVKFYGIDPARVTVAYPCVDRKLFYRRSEEDIKAVKAKHNIFDEQYIFFISNIEPRKNVSKLVDAYLALPREITKKCALVIVGGGGWNNEEILAKIQKAKEDGYHIIRPNYFVHDEDVPALLSGAVCHAFPSIYEGFGMPPLEALACGTPTVVGDIPSAHECAGDAGIYTNPDSVEDIRDKLLEAITMPEKRRAELRAKGYEQVAKFSWRKSAEITASVLTGKPLEYFAGAPAKKGKE